MIRTEVNRLFILFLPLPLSLSADRISPALLIGGSRGCIGQGFEGDFVENDPIFGRRQRSDSEFGHGTDGVGGGGVEMEGGDAGGVVKVSEDEIPGVGAREVAGLAIGQVIEHGAFLHAVLVVDGQRFHGGVEELVAGMLHVAGFEQEAL